MVFWPFLALWVVSGGVRGTKIIYEVEKVWARLPIKKFHNGKIGFLASSDLSIGKKVTMPPLSVINEPFRHKLNQF